MMPVRDDHWLVVGCGRSGLGAALLLRAKGLKVVVSDIKTPAREISAALERNGIPLIIGPQAPELLQEVSQIVLSPGISPELPFIKSAASLGIPVISEIALALADYDGTIVGVTGTNGKSTTCVMISHLLRSLGESVSEGGNLGDPPTLMLAEKRIGHHLILELSSYQLELTPNVRPSVAIFTSFSQDHMERHGTFAAYFAAKWRLVNSMAPGTLLITKPDIWRSARAFGHELPQGVRLIVIGDEVLQTVSGAHEVFTIKGDQIFDSLGAVRYDLAPCHLDSSHNRINAAFALITVSELTHKTVAVLAPLLSNFAPLPFRCQQVATLSHGHVVINDSKSTNVESTLAALTSAPGPCHLLVGGKGKGESYLPILRLKSQIKSIICFGASGAAIYAELRSEVPARLFPTLAAALDEIPAVFQAEPAPLLFSPACASFDEFTNYEHRGSFFTARIKELFGQ